MTELQITLNRIWPGWIVEETLGKGAYGTVHKIAREDKFGHRFTAALKVITIPDSEQEYQQVINEGMDEESATDYFQSVVEDVVDEIVLMSQLKGNTNIVSYEDHTIIKSEDDIQWKIFIRMELLTPLYTYMRENELSIRDVIQLGIEICNALELCQRHNIIHRDIKPENIFVSEAGRYKLGDFGIARQLEKTATGLSKKGTYSYMAPEVYKGEAYNSTVDIYSLGMVLYRLLNNNRGPFMPPYPERIHYTDRERANILRMSGKAMPCPAKAEGRLGEIVLKACAYDQDKRYESAFALREALESVVYENQERSLIYPSGDGINSYEQEDISINDDNDRTDIFHSDIERAVADTLITANDVHVEKTGIIGSNVKDEQTSYLFETQNEFAQLLKEHEEAKDEKSDLDEIENESDSEKAAMQSPYYDNSFRDKQDSAFTEKYSDGNESQKYLSVSDIKTENLQKISSGRIILVVLALSILILWGVSILNDYDDTDLQDMDSDATEMTTEYKQVDNTENDTGSISVESTEVDMTVGEEKDICITDTHETSYLETTISDTDIVSKNGGDRAGTTFIQKIYAHHVGTTQMEIKEKYSGQTILVTINVTANNLSAKDKSWSMHSHCKKFTVIDTFNDPDIYINIDDDSIIGGVGYYNPEDSKCNVMLYAKNNGTTKLTIEELNTGETLEVNVTVDIKENKYLSVESNKIVIDGPYNFGVSWSSDEGANLIFENNEELEVKWTDDESFYRDTELIVSPGSLKSGDKSFFVVKDTISKESEFVEVEIK